MLRRFAAPVFSAAFVLVSPPACVLASAAAEQPPSPRDSLLVSTAWLAEHLADPNLVLLHVGDKGEYDAAHLPGARFAAQRDVSVSSMEEGGLHLQMLPAEELRPRLAAWGISDDSRIVVYFGKDWVSPATRILFTLDYAGLGDRASLLDGGQPAWVKEGRPVTAEPLAPRTGNLSPLRLRDRIVDQEFVEAHRAKSGFSLVDARDADFFRGRSIGGGPDSRHLAGHIEGAKSFPFSDLVGDDMKVRSNEELARRFRDAGVAPGDTVVTYCHIGQQATATLLAARLAGFDTRLYDGSFEEWSRRPRAAVVATEAPAPPAEPAKP
jgi:thiosulfate/3-mercaptopyruvate sulfurtransferase